MDEKRKSKVYLEVLGCRVNISEGESILNSFLDNGYYIVKDIEEADIGIVHTCSVTNKADSKSRQLIRKFKKKNKDIFVIVTGCYAQTSPGEICDMPEVDLIVGIKDRVNIVNTYEDYIKSEDEDKKKLYVENLKHEKVYNDLKGSNFTNVRAFIKIEEGCESYCSYCIIPRARGPIRSKPLEEVVTEVYEAIAKGYREVIITGTHIGPYGDDLDSNINLVYLIRKLLEIEELERIRFGSIDPNEVTDEVVKLFSDARIMPHIHLALQSGDDDILQSMRRKYDLKDYETVVNKLRGVRQDISITTDIMVGYPTETEENHHNSMEFIKKVNINGLHIFKYSKRKNTKAALMKPQVAENIKKERSDDMQQLNSRLAREYREKFVGKVTNVLVENVLYDKEKSKYVSKGHNDNFFIVKIEEKLDINKVYKVKIIEVFENYVYGEIYNGE